VSAAASRPHARLLTWANPNRQNPLDGEKVTFDDDDT
jgi:hypothetical protein